MSILSGSQVAATTLGQKAGERNQMAFQLLLRLELIYDWVGKDCENKGAKRQHNSGDSTGFGVKPTWVYIPAPPRSSSFAFTRSVKVSEFQFAHL